MKIKLTIVVFLVATIFIAIKAGIPQHLMQHEFRGMTERARADIAVQCEKEKCWHF